MQETLRMIFRNAAGKLVSINMPDPDPDITSAEVEVVMNSVITKNVFATTGGDITAKVRAEVISRGVDVIAEF